MVRRQFDTIDKNPRLRVPSVPVVAVARHRQRQSDLSVHKLECALDERNALAFCQWLNGQSRHGRYD